MLAQLVSFCQAKEYPYRWVFVSRSLRADKDVADIERIVRTASAHGLNGSTDSIDSRRNTCGVLHK
jgi:hypothetical protein